jgi:hypothetical protein
LELSARHCDAVDNADACEYSHGAVAAVAADCGGGGFAEAGTVTLIVPSPRLFPVAPASPHIDRVDQLGASSVRIYVNNSADDGGAAVTA